MRRGSWAVLAPGVLAIALGSSVRADDPAKASKDPARASKGIEDPARVGEPGKGEGTARLGGTAETRELSGKVVKADSKTLYLEHMGAVFPLRIDEKTEFSGQGLSSSRDLSEGQEVRASFTVEKTTNVARRISLASASGRAPPAAGSQGARPEQMPPGQHPQLPPERGPGIPPDRMPTPRDPGTQDPTQPGAPASPKY